MSNKKSINSFSDIKSTNSDIGMHISENAGGIHVSGGEFSNNKIGIMIGGDPASIIELTSDPKPEKKHDNR